MLTLLFLIFVVAGIILLYMEYKNYDNYSTLSRLVCGWCCIVVAAFMLLGVCMNLYDVMTSDVYDEEIAIYEEHNAEIIETIDGITMEYMKYETDAYSELKPGEGMTRVNFYPELKSNEFVSKQIEQYIANKNAIADLESKKIDAEKARWRLYFGH